MRRSPQLFALGMLAAMAGAVAAPAFAQQHAHDAAHGEPAGAPNEAADGAQHEAHSASATLAADARVRVSLDADERRLRILVGPFDLAAADATDAMQIAPIRTIGLPVAGWVTGFAVRVLDADGAELPRSYVHHVNLVMPGRRDLFTPGLYRLAAAGAETAPIRLPWPLGIAVERDESVLVIAMMHNADDAPVRGLHVEMTIDYRPYGVLPRIPVETLYLDVGEHGARHAYDLPPGRSEAVWEGSPAVAGRILALGGHLHTHGTLLRLEDLTAGEVLWEARPQVGPGGGIVGMPRRQLLGRLGIPLSPDHRYRITAVYENPTGRTLRAGAMGTIGGVFKPARTAEWPDPDPSDPFYRSDLRAVLGDAE